MNEAGFAVGHADEDHAMMQKSGVEARNRGFLATVLRTGRSKNAPDFANEGTAEPKSAGLIEKMAHLGAYVSEANWRTENDRVGLGKLIDRGHRHLGKSGPGGLGTVFFEHIVRSELGAPDRGRLLRRGLVSRPRPLLRPCGKHARTCYKK